MKRHLLTGALLLLIVSGCRGMETDNEPIHLNPNMDWQERYDPQERSEFFENNMAMRPPVPGTVAKGFLREDTRFYTGRTEQGRFVEKAPIPVTQALLERGRERYNIYCTPCHGQAGFGQGVIMTGDYGYTPAPSYHKAALRDTADGYLYNVIANGVRNMPGYAAQVPVADRWAIVAYIRALQRSQNAQRENVPPSVLARIEQTGSANMNAARNPQAPATGGGGGTTGGASGSNATPSSDTTGGAGASPDAGASDAASEEPPADTSAAGPTASADTALSGSAADTAATAASSAPMDTTSGSTAVAEDAGATESAAAAQVGNGEAATEESGGLFGSTFFILMLVVLPILALTTMLIVAFRKDREH